MVSLGEPDTPSCLVVEDVFGNGLRDVSLELQAEAFERLVDLAVKGDDAAKVAAAQYVSDTYRQLLEASQMLAIDASSIASNSPADCCALRPSDRAREKLATMPFWRDKRSFASSRE